MKRAMITGSFDPPTRGHLDIITRSASLFDEVVVCLCVNSEKKYMFSLEKRKEMLNAMCRPFKNVRVDSTDGLVASYARDSKVDVIIKGARNGSDFEYEKMLRSVNMSVYPVDTLILPTRPELEHISSLTAREMIKHKAPLSDYLTPEVISLIYDGALA